MTNASPSPPPDPVPTIDQRRAAGLARRTTLRRADQGRWSAATDRPDPVELLTQANAGRLADLLPVKWGRMAASPFGFFRGAAPLMATDLAAWPTSGLLVQLCGDAHVCNLGAYAAPDGHLVFDLNDFDETLPEGPWEWDVKRLATSLILANREAGGRDGDGVAAVQACVQCYRESLGRFAAMKGTELMSYEVHPPSKSGPVDAILQKAERATPAKTLAKLTEPGPAGEPRFHDRPPLLRPALEAEAAKVVAALGPYRDTVNLDRRHALDGYRPVDVAFKVVGTGSVGTRDFVVLLLGRGPDDPLFLQVKEELPSCWQPFLPAAGSFPNQGQRVAEGQRRCQTATDPFLGWTTLEGRDCLVRQLADHKAAINPADLKGPALTEYALVCGETLAKAHARTGDPAALSGYCGTADRLDRALADFAVAYAAQTMLDHASLVQAIHAGRLISAVPA